MSFSLDDIFKPVVCTCLRCGETRFTSEMLFGVDHYNVVCKCGHLMDLEVSGNGRPKNAKTLTGEFGIITPRETERRQTYYEQTAIETEEEALQAQEFTGRHVEQGDTLSVRFELDIDTSIGSNAFYYE